MAERDINCLMGAILAHSPQDDFVKQEERHRQILELLRLNGYQSVDSLSQKLSVSEMTIRRDSLAESQQLELVARHFGGASMAPERGELEWPYPLRPRADDGQTADWQGRCPLIFKRAMWLFWMAAPPYSRLRSSCCSVINRTTTKTNKRTTSPTP